MRLKKSIITHTVILSIITTNTSFAAMKLTYDGKEHNYTAEPITLMVNKKTVKTDMPPVILDGRTLVPARAVFEEVGATILWLAETKEIFITQEDNIVLLKVDDNKANINGQIKTMEVAPKIINNSTMIPLRFVAEALNFEINWDEKNRIASVNSSPKEIEVVIPETSDTTETTDNDDIIQDIINTPIQGLNGEIVRFKSAGNYKPDTGNKSPIIPENNNIVDIISVDASKSIEELFKITANGRISTVKYGVIENPTRLYIDIENSITKLDPSISPAESGIVTGIRTAHQGNNITRIVFDIPTGENYDVYLSEDRTSVNVKFKPMIVNEITFQSIAGQDIVNIYSNGIFKPKIMELSNPDRIIIDIPNAISSIGTNAANIAGNVTSAIRTSQFDSNTVRIVLDKTKLISYEINSNNLCTTIKLTEPTYKNISYENNNTPRMVLKKDNTFNLNINAFTHKDKYLDGYYKIILPGNYSKLYGYGDYKINDKYIDYINIQNNDGNTEITFNQKTIHAYTVTEDAQNIYINILNPKQIYKNIVFIDPGHGGAAPGNVNNGVTEKVVNLDVSNRLYLLLDADPNIKVYATRTTDVDIPRPERASMASPVANMFVSIHCNSVPSANMANVSGVQVFYPNPSNNRGATSQKMSDIFRETVSKSIGIPNRPADQTLGYEYTVLSQTTIPACLIELGFLTNKTDATKLASPEGRQAAAQGIYEGIKQIFSTVITSNN